MANYPKKMTDPTEAALSAIQEALNIQQDKEQATGRPEAAADVLPGSSRGQCPKRGSGTGKQGPVR